MRIEQLQAFLAIAESGNFGQAARKCGITQSTVSRQIQSLESDLGFPLFHRTAQAKLTVAGEKLLPRARKICQEWETASQEIADLQAGKQPELCIAAIHSVCSHYLPPILQKFCRDFPEIQLRVTALGSDRALKVLRDGLVDVAVVMNNRFLTARCDLLHVGFEAFKLAARAGHRVKIANLLEPQHQFENMLNRDRFTQVCKMNNSFLFGSLVAGSLLGSQIQVCIAIEPRGHVFENFVLGSAQNMVACGMAQ
jgi:DNA-binding transcriptional LysR family regulator